MHRALATSLLLVCIAGCSVDHATAQPPAPAPITAPPAAVLIPAPPKTLQVGTWTWIDPPVQRGVLAAWTVGDSAGAHVLLRDRNVVRELVSSQEPLNLAGWWPDGSGLLVWHSWGYCNSCNADGLRLASLTLDGRFTDLANVDMEAGGYYWSSSGRRLLIGTGGDRFVIFGKPRVLVCDFPEVSCLTVPSPPGQLDLTPAWSPDFHFITFARGPAPQQGENINATVATWQDNLTLWIARSDGSGQEQLDTPGGSYPTWSDDGRLIYFMRGGNRWIHNLYSGQNIDTGVAVSGNVGRGWINYSGIASNP